MYWLAEDQPGTEMGHFSHIRWIPWVLNGSGQFKTEYLRVKGALSGPYSRWILLPQLAPIYCAAMPTQKTASHVPAGIWSARNTSAPALVTEATQVLRWIGDGGGLDKVGEAIRSGELLHLRTQSGRVAFSDALRRRYLDRTPVWALTDLVRASRRQGDDLRHLLYIHFCREDAFARALVRPPAPRDGGPRRCPRWQGPGASRGDASASHRCPPGSLRGSR